MFTVPEKFRVTSGPMGSSADFGNNGAFEVRLKLGQKVMVIASDQYHPPKSAYVNNHPNCLHLWRPIGIEMPRPPSIMVGIAS